MGLYNLSFDETVSFKYLTVGRPQKTDLVLISNHCQEPFLSCAAVTGAIFAVRQTPKCPKFSHKSWVSANQIGCPGASHLGKGLIFGP